MVENEDYKGREIPLWEVIAEMAVLVLIGFLIGRIW